MSIIKKKKKKKKNLIVISIAIINLTINRLIILSKVKVLFSDNSTYNMYLTTFFSYNSKNVVFIEKRIYLFIK